jgi:hypothetical protein
MAEACSRLDRFQNYRILPAQVLGGRVARRGGGIIEPSP